MEVDKSIENLPCFSIFYIPLHLSKCKVYTTSIRFILSYILFFHIIFHTFYSFILAICCNNSEASVALFISEMRR